MPQHKTIHQLKCFLSIFQIAYVALLKLDLLGIWFTQVLDAFSFNKILKDLDIRYKISKFRFDLKKKTVFRLLGLW